MREIKFRAWDKRHKYMDDDFFLHSYLGSYQRASKTYDTPNTEIQGTDDLIIMQYVGLKDKNGKEIYEGDIVKVFNGTEGEILTEVFLYDYGWRFKRIDNNEAWYFYQWENDETGIEIIGNIYQNPELLKEN